MLIINADDYGRNRSATDKTLHCFEKGGITSATGMMYMRDSERSAEMAQERQLDIGLHLNFTEPFSGASTKPGRLIEYQRLIAAFLKKNQYMFLLYNPLLQKHFDYVFSAQYEEYVRLFRKIPSHVDGHHHMHLCTNMILGGLIPRGVGVRRSFSFSAGEKGFFNRLYRRIVDSWLGHKYLVTDFFFGISGIGKSDRLQRAMNLSTDSNVELMVHPETNEDFEFLTSKEYLRMISCAKMGTYCNLREQARRPQRKLDGVRRN
jgi:chitin disaccharide deacetylase